MPEHLLPRLYGYELMMASYAIAHMKIGLKLHEAGYRFQSDERVRVYLTNALEPASDVRITIETLPPVKEPDFKPQTEFGQRLLEIRQQAIAKGMPLKTTDEILAEIREDRREANDDPNLR